MKTVCVIMTPQQVREHVYKQVSNVAYRLDERVQEGDLTAIDLSELVTELIKYRMDLEAAEKIEEEAV